MTPSRNEPTPIRDWWKEVVITDPSDPRLVRREQPPKSHARRNGWRPYRKREKD